MTSIGGRKQQHRTSARNSINNNKTRRTNKHNGGVVSDLTDSLQAELHLSLDKLSDGELDQDDLNRLKKNQKKRQQRYKKISEEEIIDTQDSLEMVENKQPNETELKNLPRLLQRASEGGDILDSLDDTDIREDDDRGHSGRTYHVDNHPISQHISSSYEQLMNDQDPYADLRYNYLPPPDGVLQPVENFMDDVSEKSEYRYYDDGGSTVTGGGAVEQGRISTETEASLQEEHDKLEHEYQKHFAANGGMLVPSSGIALNTSASNTSANTGTSPNSVKKLKVRQPPQKQVYEEQFDRAAQKLRHHSTTTTSPPQEKAKTTQRKTAALATTNKKAKQQQVENIIERNRARAGKKSNSAGYLDIHAKKRNKKQKISTDGSKKSPPDLPELRIAKSETNLLNKSEVVPPAADEKRVSVEETWILQAEKLKEMRKVGGTGKSKIKPKRQFLKITTPTNDTKVSPKTSPRDSLSSKSRQEIHQISAHDSLSSISQQQLPQVSALYYPPTQHYVDPSLTSTLLPPQRIHPPTQSQGGTFVPLPPPPHGGAYAPPPHNGHFAPLPYNGNMMIDPHHINGGYYYPPPPSHQYPVYYHQGVESSSLPPQPQQKQPLPPIPRTSPSNKPSDDQNMSPKSQNSIHYRKYTLDDYRNFQRDQMVHLGGLGPDLSTARTKADKATRAKQYAEAIRQQNNRRGVMRQQTTAVHPRIQAEEDAQAVKRKRQMARQRALSYAREVPKPKVTTTAPFHQEDNSHHQEAQRASLPVGKSRIPRPEAAARGRTKEKSPNTFTVDHKSSDNLKRRSSSTFTIDKTNPSSARGGAEGGGVDMDLIRALRERHEREKALVAQIGK